MENTVSLFALREAQACIKGYEISKLHLNYHGGALSAKSVIKKALEVVKDGFVTGRDRKDTLGDVLEVLEEYPVRPNELVAESEMEKAKAYRRIDAMTTFLWGLEGRKEKNVCFSFETGGFIFKDKADLVIEKDGNPAKAIIFDCGGSLFSTRARKPENHPSRCLGVAMLSAAGYVDPEVWYLKSKDEEKDIVPAFEVRPEKNIVRATVGTDEARAYLLSVITNAACGDCKNCRHKSVCKIREVRIEQKHVSGGKNEPSFTAEQQKAVEHKTGPMALIAVPGAGKTTVLVHRLLRLLQDGIPAKNILFVTFTKKAAGEIRERIEALLPEGAEVPAIYTFNALGYTLLKDNPTLVGKRVKLADDNDIKGMIRQVLEGAAKKGRYLRGMSYSGAYLEYGLISRLAGWFDEIAAVGKEEFTRRRGEKVSDLEGVFTLYDEYDRLFKKSSFITYDEQITLVNDIFRKYPKVSGDTAGRFQYIMVDEYQDTSDAQAEMIYTIARHHNNIVVVGDDDQSIYGWRGGSNKYLLKFKESFPEAEVVIMNDNFRSNDKILTAADSVISTNRNRYEKSLRGHREAAFPPLFFQNSSDRKLAEVIPSLLRQYKAGDIAILARTNKRLGEVEGVLSGIVKMSTPKDYLIEDAVFEILYDVLTLYYNLKDDAALYRCLIRLGVTRIPEKAGPQISLYDAIREAEPGFNLNRIDVKAAEGYKAGLTPVLNAGKILLAALKKIQYYRSMEEVFTAVADAFQISVSHKVYSGLLDTCDEHAFVRISELYAYMRDMMLFKSTRRVGYGAAEDAVSLLTAHDSKGQEFPVVILYGTEDFAGMSEEDNCLLYVAMTRAKNTLIMIEGAYAEQSALKVGNIKEYVNIR